MSNRDFEALLGVLETYLKSEVKSEDCTTGVTEDALDALERHLPRPLPPEFRHIYRWRDGFSFLEADCADLMYGYVPMKLSCIAETWRELVKLEVDSTSGDKEDGILYPFWSAGWIPFLRYTPSGQDYLVIDLLGSFGGEPGQILEFNTRGSSRSVRFQNLTTWLSVIVGLLEAYQWERFDLDGEEQYGVPELDFEAFCYTHSPGCPIEHEAVYAEAETEFSFVERLLEVWGEAWGEVPGADDEYGELDFDELDLDIYRGLSLEEVSLLSVQDQIRASEVAPISTLLRVSSEQLIDEITKLCAHCRLVCGPSCVSDDVSDDPSVQSRIFLVIDRREDWQIDIHSVKARVWRDLF